MALHRCARGVTRPWRLFNGIGVADPFGPAQPVEVSTELAQFRLILKILAPMTCRVRYLNSAGIHRREIPGIGALSSAYPANWLLYASLQCFPRGDTPIEMDAVVVTDDRILILELKDLNGSLTHNGDIWQNKRRRFRSPVQGVALKARKLKSFLVANIPQFQFYVDSRVVLTGSATKQDLSAQEQPSVWTLQEAASIATTAGKQSLLSRARLLNKKAFSIEPALEQLMLNPRMFGPLEAEWDGYRVVDEKFVAHPADIWSEHLAEQISNARFKALLRLWAFDKLPPGLNSPEERRFIAEREIRAIGRLHELGSNLIDRNAILAPIGEEKEEILTQHFELRRLTSGLTTLDRYLQRASEDLSLDDRITQAATLMEIVSELHAQGIVHRDLGPRAVWAASPTRVALGGLMSCQLPDEQSLGDWSPLLRGYADRLPEDDDKSLSGTSKQRDVYSLGRLTFRILTDAKPQDYQETCRHNFRLHCPNWRTGSIVPSSMMRRRGLPMRARWRTRSLRLLSRQTSRASIKR
jgi:hypothetical protein